MFTGYTVLDIISIFILTYFLFYLYYTRNFNYWKKRGVPYLKPTAFFGNLRETFTFKLSIGEAWKQFYESSKAPYVGIFVCDEPALVIRDPEIIKSIIIKDFAYFIDRTITENKKDDPMGSHILFILKNPDWKEIRRKITPVFTSGKMKLMYKLILESGEELVKYLDKIVDDNTEMESREVCAKYTTEAITSTAFGIKANCFIDENAEFRVVSRKIFNWNSVRRGVATTAYFIAPNLVKLFQMKFIDGPSGDFLRKTFWKTMEDRDKSNYVRNDLLDILIQMKKDENIDDPYKLEGDKLVAQATQFFIAGFETTSSTISFCLYELARNKDIQSKLREEIRETKEKYGSLTYDALKEMKYLDMIINETLRMYPSLPFLDRRCNKDYIIPGTNHVIEKGTPVFIPSLGLHFDEQYFPDPEKFNPERFTEENVKNRLPYTYLPFGDGPRNCIGARFGLLSSKSGVSHIISNFEVNLSPKTQKVMKFDPKGFLLAPVKGLWLNFTKIKKIS